ncbi:hypothetical protein FQP90_13725 [Paenarthrobacter nitroguajacolicus]|uniref:Uncharacterized protein n=1 Tax=Paenarthrobacter nitroguajacolicus TaxID=211146 RepID=A0A558GXI9_PAENT|nr:hypothetical protein [Paenarthrobacter nitroguajacolicus]TVU61595.1 hypothetical protein FQP90_13725 [Paenarthrobacter nitroguajacolicus]
MTSTIKIQQAEIAGVLPYPYFIDVPTGNVGRQDFWRGHPAKLIGFASSDEFDVALTLPDFIDSPGRAHGLRPIFENSNGAWFTHPQAVESTTVQGAAA